MNDLWYTFGAMVSDPGLLAAMAKHKPVFTPIVMKVRENNNPEFEVKAAGYLDQDSTTALRRSIRDYLAQHFGKTGPMISLYAAGKISQLLNTFSDFKAVFDSAHTAFTKAGGKKTSSVALLTIMGASLVDQQLSSLLKAGDAPFPGDSIPPTVEFGLDPASPEHKVFQKWLTESDFTSAQTKFLAADSWDPGPCRETFSFYDGFARAAN